MSDLDFETVSPWVPDSFEDAIDHGLGAASRGSPDVRLGLSGVPSPLASLAQGLRGRDQRLGSSPQTMRLAASLGVLIAKEWWPVRRLAAAKAKDFLRGNANRLARLNTTRSYSWTTQLGVGVRLKLSVPLAPRFANMTMDLAGVLNLSISQIVALTFVIGVAQSHKLLPARWRAMTSEEMRHFYDWLQYVTRNV